MAPETFIVNFEFPFKGLDAVNALSQTQPPFTTVDCLNVIPVDRNYRIVGGQRPGLTLAYNTVAPAGNVSGLSYAKTIRSSNSFRLIATMTAAAGQPAWIEYSVATTGVLTQIDAGLFTGIAANSAMRLASNATDTYAVADSYSTPQVRTWDNNPTLYAFAAVVASAGTVPTNVSLITFWRDRLVVSGQLGAPYLLYASRVSDPTDWDTAPLATGDPASAFAINLGQAGKIGDTITALIPISDDMLLVGCSRSIYRIDGDPADGGSVSLVTTATGILSQEGVCQADDGYVYFMGGDGMYRLRSGGEVQPLSEGRIPRLLRKLNVQDSEIHMVFDPIRDGVWVFVYNVATAVQSSVFYYIPSGGYFPISFGNLAGPLSAIRYKNDASSFIFMGAIDNIYFINDNAMTDDGTTISSRVYIGAVMPEADTREAKLLSIEAILADKQPSDDNTAPTYADANWNLNYEIRAGTDQLSAYTAPAQTQTGSWVTSGRQVPKSHRMAENSFMIRLYNSTASRIWAMQRIIARFQRAGQNR